MVLPSPTPRGRCILSTTHHPPSRSRRCARCLGDAGDRPTVPGSARRVCPDRTVSLLPFSCCHSSRAASEVHPSVGRPRSLPDVCFRRRGRARDGSPWSRRPPRRLVPCPRSTPCRRWSPAGVLGPGDARKTGPRPRASTSPAGRRTVAGLAESSRRAEGRSHRAGAGRQPPRPHVLVAPAAGHQRRHFPVGSSSPSSPLMSPPQGYAHPRRDTTARWEPRPAVGG